MKYSTPEDILIIHAKLIDETGGLHGQKSWNFYNKKYDTELDREDWKNQVEMSARVLAEKDGWRNWINCTRDRNIKY